VKLPIVTWKGCNTTPFDYVTYQWYCVYNLFHFVSFVFLFIFFNNSDTILFPNFLIEQLGREEPWKIVTRLIEKTPLGKVLSKYNAISGTELFSSYVHDFVRMVYQTASIRPDLEYQVWKQFYLQVSYLHVCVTLN